MYTGPTMNELPMFRFAMPCKPCTSHARVGSQQPYIQHATPLVNHDSLNMRTCTISKRQSGGRNVVAKSAASTNANIRTWVLIPYAPPGEVTCALARTVNNSEWRVRTSQEGGRIRMHAAILKQKAPCTMTIEYTQVPRLKCVCVSADIAIKVPKLVA